MSRRGHVFTPAQTRDYERLLSHLIRSQYTGAPLSVPISVQIKFIMKRPKSAKNRPFPSVKPDMDNLIKAIWDAANGILWVDDALICEAKESKVYGHEAGIEVVVSPLVFEASS